eukprot:tig00021759_g23423.t2
MQRPAMYLKFVKAVEENKLKSPHDLDYLTDGPRSQSLATVIQKITRLAPNVEKSGCTDHTAPDGTPLDTPVAVVSPVRMDGQPVFLYTRPGWSNWFVGTPDMAKGWLAQKKVLFSYAKKTYMCCPKGSRFATDGTDRLKPGCYTGHLPLASNYPEGPNWIAEGWLKSVANIPKAAISAAAPQMLDTYTYTVDASQLDQLQADAPFFDDAEAGADAYGVLDVAGADGYEDYAFAASYPGDAGHNLL